MATVSIRHARNHAAIRFRSAVQQPNSCAGFGSRSGGTATKWLSLPTSIPLALGWTIVRPRIITSQPPPQRSALAPIHRATTQSFERGFLLLAIAYSCGWNRTQARLGLRKTTDSRGSSRTLFRGQHATNQCIAAAEVMLLCYAGTEAPIPYRPSLAARFHQQLDAYSPAASSFWFNTWRERVGTLLSPGIDLLTTAVKAKRRVGLP